MDKEELLIRICLAASELSPIQFKIYLDLLLFKELVGEKFLFRTVEEWGSVLGYSEATARRELKNVLKTRFVKGVNLEGGGVKPGYFANDFAIPVSKKLLEPLKGVLLYLYLYNKKKEEEIISYQDTGNYFVTGSAESLEKDAKKGINCGTGVAKSLEKLVSEEKRTYTFEFWLNPSMTQVKNDYNARIAKGKLYCEPWLETNVLPESAKRAILRAFEAEPTPNYWLALFDRLESPSCRFSVPLSFNRLMREHRRWSNYTAKAKKSQIPDY